MGNLNGDKKFEKIKNKVDNNEILLEQDIMTYVLFLL